MLPFLSFSMAFNALEAKEINYEAGGRRDPFIPLTGSDASGAIVSSSGIRLEGIIYDPLKQSLVILNGRAYKIGETVGDATVRLIQKDRVVISVNGEEKVLLLREDDKPH